MRKSSSWFASVSSWSCVRMSPAYVARARLAPKDLASKKRRTGFHSVPGELPSSNGMSSMCATL